MLVQVDFYKSSGKAYASGRVECDKMPWVKSYEKTSVWK